MNLSMMILCAFSLVGAGFVIGIAQSNKSVRSLRHYNPDETIMYDILYEDDTFEVEYKAESYFDESSNFMETEIS